VYLLSLVIALLGAYAYRDLLSFKPERQALDVEQFFFVPEDTAGAVVIALALWLLYRRRHQLFALVPRSGPPWIWLPLLAVGIGVYAWAYYASAPDLLAISLCAHVLAMACLCAGTPAMRVVALPAAFLLFAVPLPAPALTELIYSMQLATADYAGLLLFAIGSPAHVSGDVIYRPAGTFQVIESCSGLRSVEILTMLSILMVDLFDRRPLHCWIIVLLAPFVAFGLNGFRALTLILNPHSDVVAIHVLQGIVVLLGGMTFLYLVDGWLERRLGAAPASPPPGQGGPEGAAAMEGSFGSPWVGVAALAACAGLSLWMPHFVVAPPPVPNLLTHIPEQLGSWTKLRDLPNDRLFLERVGLRQTLHRRYARPRGSEVDLFIAAGNHDSRFRSPFSPKTAYPGSGWWVEAESEERLGEDGPEVVERILRKGAKRLLVYHWYEGTRGRVDEVVRAMLALDSSPFRRDEEGVVVRMSTPIAGGTEASVEDAAARLEDLYARLRTRLRVLSQPDLASTEVRGDEAS